MIKDGPESGPRISWQGIEVKGVDLCVDPEFCITSSANSPLGNTILLTRRKTPIPVYMHATMNASWMAAWLYAFWQA